MCYNRDVMLTCGCAKIKELRSSTMDIIEDSIITDDLKNVALKYLMLQSLNFILETNSELCDKICGQNMCIYCGRIFRAVNDKQLLLVELSTMELGKLVQKTRKLFVFSEPNGESYEEAAYDFNPVITTNSDGNNMEDIQDVPSSNISVNVNKPVNSNLSAAATPWFHEDIQDVPSSNISVNVNKPVTSNLSASATPWFPGTRSSNTHVTTSYPTPEPTEEAYGFAPVTTTDGDVTHEEDFQSVPSSNLHFNVHGAIDSSVAGNPWFTQIRSRKSSTSSNSSKASSKSPVSKDFSKTHSILAPTIKSFKKPATSTRRSSMSSTSGNRRTQSKDSPNLSPVPKIDSRSRKQEKVQRSQSSRPKRASNEASTSSSANRSRSVPKALKDSYKPKPLVVKTYSEEYLTMSARASNYNSQRSAPRIFKETISSLCKKNNACNPLEVSNIATRNSKPSVTNSRIMRETVSSSAKRHVVSDDVKAQRISKLKSRKINEVQEETKSKKKSSKQIRNRCVSLDSASIEEIGEVCRSRSDTFTITKGCNQCGGAKSEESDSGVDNPGRSSGSRSSNSASSSGSSPNRSLSVVETIATTSDSDVEDQRSFDEYVRERALESKQRNEESLRDMKRIKMKIQEVRNVISVALASTKPKN